MTLAIDSELKPGGVIAIEVKAETNVVERWIERIVFANFRSGGGVGVGIGGGSLVLEGALDGEVEKLLIVCDLPGHGRSLGAIPWIDSAGGGDGLPEGVVEFAIEPWSGGSEVYEGRIGDLREAGDTGFLRGELVPAGDRFLRGEGLEDGVGRRCIKRVGSLGAGVGGLGNEESDIAQEVWV